MRPIPLLALVLGGCLMGIEDVGEPGPAGMEDPTMMPPATPPAACGSCHSIDGTNMSGQHRRHIVEENMQCNECHATVVDAARTIIAPNLHANGLHEVVMASGTYDAARTCTNTGCHGSERW